MEEFSKKEKETAQKESLQKVMENVTVIIKYSIKRMWLRKKGLFVGAELQEKLALYTQTI